MITKTPYDEFMQEKFEKFWEIESFETKTVNDIVCDNFHKDICFREVESRYQVQLSCPAIVIAKPK